MAIHSFIGSERKDYGMPSSHAQFVGYLYGNVDELVKLVWLPGWLVRLATLVVTVLVPVSRVYLEYHYEGQVLIGLMLGYAFATLWHKLLTVIKK